MGVRIQELPETTGIKKEDVLIVEDGQGTKKGTVQQLDEALGVSQLKEDLVNLEGADGLPYYIPLEDLEMQNGFYNRDSTIFTESEWYRTFYYRLKPYTKYVLKVSYDNITQRVYDDFRIIKEDGTILYYAYNLAGKGTREIEWVSPDNGYYLTITVKVGQTGSIKEYGGRCGNGWIPLSKDELNEIIDKVISSTGAENIKDFGKVMKEITPLVKNRCDMKELSNSIKERLNH